MWRGGTEAESGVCEEQDIIKICQGPPISAGFQDDQKVLLV